MSLGPLAIRLSHTALAHRTSVYDHLLAARRWSGLTKVDQHAAQGQLACASLPGIIRRLNAVVIDQIGHAITGQSTSRSLDLEVNMLLVRISGVSNLTIGASARVKQSEMLDDFRSNRQGTNEGLNLPQSIAPRDASAGHVGDPRPP